MDINKFGEFIIQLRHEEKLTQKELGEKLFISDKAISKWERGISFPNINMLISISNFFNVSIAELLMGEKSDTTDLKQFNDNVVNSLKKKEKTNSKKERIKTLITVGLIALASFIVVYAIDFICVFNSFKQPIFAVQTYSHHIISDGSDYFENNYFGLFYNYYTRGYYKNGKYEISYAELTIGKKSIKTTFKGVKE